jgi:hypothetical protein
MNNILKKEEAAMKMKQGIILISAVALSTMLSFGRAEANGTLILTFQYVNNSGVATPLNYAYVYLHLASESAPMEQYLSAADYIFGPSDSTGKITASVPAGSYHVRITRRNTTTSPPNPLGPPLNGDYTWMQTVPITISNNITTNLGTQNSTFFGTSNTISGTVTNRATGAPVPGIYVRAQLVPCILGNYTDYPNRCGPQKFAALTPTDANGKYTLQLRAPGTYYLYASQCIGDRHQTYQANPCMGIENTTDPVTVNAGDSVTVNFPLYCYTLQGGVFVCGQ